MASFELSNVVGIIDMDGFMLKRDFTARNWA